MPPRTKQLGYEKSDCSFYWLHFMAEEQSAAALCPVETYEVQA